MNHNLPQKLQSIGKRFGAGFKATPHKIIFEIQIGTQTFFCPTEKDAINFGYTALGQLPFSVIDFYVSTRGVTVALPSRPRSVALIRLESERQV